MKRIRKPYNAPPAVHKRSASGVVGANGVRTAVPDCGGNGWVMTDDWAAVTCKRCIRRKPKEGER